MPKFAIERELAGGGKLPKQELHVYDLTRIDGTLWPRSTVDSMLTLTPDCSVGTSSDGGRW